jgi:drug/metabolite transporter (DMT)-like permease
VSTSGLIRVRVREVFVPATWWTVAAVCLNAALQVNDGSYAPLGVGLLLAAALACAAGFVVRRQMREQNSSLAHTVLLVLLWVGVTVQAALSLTRKPAMFLILDDPSDIRWFVCAIVVFASGLGLLTGRSLAGGAFPIGRAVPLILVLYVIVGIWNLAHTRGSRNDVRLFQEHASA